MIKVRVPATTANIGPGFDCLGMALSLYNTIEVEENSKGLVIESTGIDQHLIDRDEKNLVYQSMMKGFKALGYMPSGLRIKLHNEIPIARGLGSSAACIVGGIVAANKICNGVLGTEEILELAVEMEGHPDNVAPALLGGVVVSNQGRNKIHYVQFPIPEKLKFIAAVPDIGLSTKKARGVLPQFVSYEDAIFNVGKVSLLVAALLTGNLEEIEVALEDRLHQPYRFSLMDSLERIFQEAAKNQLRNIFLSGAGPSVIVLNWRGLEDEKNQLIRIVENLPEKWSVKVLEGDNKGVK